MYAVAGWAEDDSLVVDADITGYLPAGRNGKVSVSIVYNYWASNPRKYYILDDETGEYARWQSPDRFAGRHDPKRLNWNKMKRLVLHSFSGFRYWQPQRRSSGRFAPRKSLTRSTISTDTR